jgi:hypothetical protein
MTTDPYNNKCQASNPKLPKKPWCKSGIARSASLAKRGMALNNSIPKKAKQRFV